MIRWMRLQAVFNDSWINVIYIYVCFITQKQKYTYEINGFRVNTVVSGPKILYFAEYTASSPEYLLRKPQFPVG